MMRNDITEKEEDDGASVPENYRETTAVVQPCEENERGTTAVVQPCEENERGTTAVVQPCEENERGTTAVVQPCEENERGVYSEKNARCRHTREKKKRATKRKMERCV